MASKKKAPLKSDPVFEIPRNKILHKQSPDGTISILSLDEERFLYRISGLSKLVWQSFDGRTPLSKITQKICKAHPQHAAKLPALIKSFIKDLLKYKLVQPKN